MGGIFISHASADDAFVAELRQRLEERGHATWVDSRQLRPGDGLTPEIEAAIAQAPALIVVLSPATVNSAWVAREVSAALRVQQERANGTYRVIPLLLPGITTGALGMWFPDQHPLAVSVGADGLMAALPHVLAALGARLPTDPEEFLTPSAGVMEELVLRLSGPRMVTRGGVRRAWATAHLSYDPAGSGRREVDEDPFAVLAPLGPIEINDLRWYLESYYLWPVGVFRERARRIEAKLPQWGRALLSAVHGKGAAFGAWEQAGREGALLRFTVLVDATPPIELPDTDIDVDTDGEADPQAQVAAREEARAAATDLLGLPWELLHDGDTWLFQGRHAVRVRRRLPNRTDMDEQSTGLPIRVLLVSPRPGRTDDGDPVGYIDHRASALPLVEAVENLGELARLTVLNPPTYAALERALDHGDQGQRFDVVHFDGHGTYDPRHGLGGLCFEQPAEQPRGERVLDLVHADRLAGLVRDHRIPLVFLDACKTALSDTDPTASVAARLLDQGVGSVVAMTHSVLVETARRFVQAFYSELATGARVGTAMLAGQKALFADARRGPVPGAGELRLQDWFVPVLYQERLDPQPITRLPAPTVARLAEQGRKLRLGDLPEPPEHHFQGRSRELLTLERHLHAKRWAVIRGTGGQGKTTLAVELSRWLVRTHRAHRGVFVNLEHHRDPRAVLDTIGRQLVPNYTVATHDSLEDARQPVDRALTDQPVILVIDNCEAILPDPILAISQTVDTDSTKKGGEGDCAVATDGSAGTDAGTSGRTDDVAAGIFALCRKLLAASPGTRVVFTTREPLATPFNRRDHEWELRTLSRSDAVELVGQVMSQHGWTPPATDPGATPEEITELVEAVHGHPRALVLLAREIAQKGVRGTTADLQALMAKLDRQHPGGRENSLYASAALSIRRLPPDTRQHLPALACCRGGVHLAVLADLTGLDADGTRRFAVELITVGLGEDMGQRYLRLDPGLTPYLRIQQTPAQTEAVQARWAAATAKLTRSLEQAKDRDAREVASLTRLELPNLLALLDWLPDHESPNLTVNLATSIEYLLRFLGQPRALARAVAVRKRAAGQLTGWNHARHEALTAEIDRLYDRGELPAALAAAQQLFEHHDAAGETAYPGAAFDTASAFVQLGRMLAVGGAAQEALTLLNEAQRRLQHLADTDDSAARMFAATLTEIGESFQLLGRWGEATTAYQDGIERSTQLGDRRAAALGEGRLASLRLRQCRYQEALEGFTKARATFEALDDTRSLAVVSSQIGHVHERAGRFDAAENAYREALAIHVRQSDLQGQATTLGQLGNLCQAQSRLEESATFLRQAIDLFTITDDRVNLVNARNNIASTLIDLNRYDQAREEIQRAIEGSTNFGHVTAPWTSWTILADVEKLTGHPDAARVARQKAIAAYQAYRRDGGYSTARSNIYAAALRAIRDDQQDKLAQELDQLLAPDTPPWAATIIWAVRAILTGHRDFTLADHPDIHPIEAAELLLLLDATTPYDPTTTD